MIFLEEKVNVSWRTSNVNYYKSLGYKFTHIGDQFEIPVKDLPKTSKIIVNCKCDFCGEKFEKSYHLANLQGEIIACKKCTKFKREKTNLEKYGSISPLKNEEIRQKTINNNLQKYGCEWALSNKQVREKINKTVLDKYGVNNISQNKEIKEKINNTMIEKYGVINPMQNDEIKHKVKNTNIKRYGSACPLNNQEVLYKAKKTLIDKYGVHNISQHVETKKEITKKINYSLYKNGTAPCSKQQRHLHDLLGGELNYPIDRCMLDIAFPDEMIYIEYDGSGHDLSVKLGHVTKDQFKQSEINRQYMLKNKGWSLIKIISNDDILPSDNDIIKLINTCKILLIQRNISWININLNTRIIKSNKFEMHIEEMLNEKIN